VAAPVTVALAPWHGLLSRNIAPAGLAAVRQRHAIPPLGQGRVVLEAVAERAHSGAGGHK